MDIKKLKLVFFDISCYVIFKIIYSVFVLYDLKCYKIYKRNK